MKQTKYSYSIINYRGYGHVTIRAGTRITNMTACGFDPTYNFVDDLSFMHGTTRTNMMKHEAYYYGIVVPTELIETV